MIRVEQNTIHVETKTLTAEIARGWLTSLRRRSDGVELLPGAREAAAQGAAMELVYRGGEVVPINPARFGEAVCRRVSDRAAEVRLHGWDGDGVLFVSVDEASGELIVEPADMARTGRAAVNRFLFGRLCRTIGYHHLSGREEGDEHRMRLDADLGTIPTLTIRDAEEIRHPNPAAQEVLTRARQT